MTTERVFIEPLGVSVKEAVRISARSRAHLYEKIASGELDASKAGTRTIIDYQSLKKLLASQPQGIVREHPNLVEGRRRYQAVQAAKAAKRKAKRAKSNK
jgi:hypothetical protein